MADEKTEALIETKGEKEKVEKDPIADQSLSGIMLISSLILVLTLGWAIYDEVFGMRPWKSVQDRFVTNYTRYLKKLKPVQVNAEKDIRASAKYQELDAAMKAAEEEAAPRVKEIDAEVNGITQKISALTVAMQEARSHIAALTYQLEQAGEKKKVSYRREIDDVKKGPYTLELPADDGGKPKRQKMSYPELDDMFRSLKDRKAELLAERVSTLKNAADLRQKRDAYLQENLAGLTDIQIAGLVNKMEKFDVKIYQINVAEANLVDRCTSCHLGIREPLSISRTDAVAFLYPKKVGKKLNMEEREDVAALMTHPDKELIQKHDPDRFGCSPCHGGNGRATSGVVKAHGKNPFWLWPLYDKENTEAGCQQCHSKDRGLAMATTLNQGKDLFQVKGCVGCHRYEGYDRETDALFTARQTVLSLEKERTNNLHEIDRVTKAADNAASNEEAQRLYARADNLRVTNSQIDAQIDQLQIQAKFLMQDQKKVGPNLKEVRLKLRKEWIPVWLKNTFDFRPETKMPNFRLQEDEIKDIAAFIWQSGVQGQLPEQPPGDPEKGKQSLESRGCLACHGIGEGGERHGGTFATNLSRLGEKANYNYIFRWIHNPRERTRPYCPKEKRDIGPEDYAKHGLPYVFDLDHTKCPNDGAEMQVQNMTVMPNLRLSEQETRDIASYLLTLKHSDASYPDASFMDDPNRKTRGLALVKNYGCAGCHEISGLEEEGRIGTELTKEGSKPIERLDFAMLMHEAKREGNYNHKGFFSRKLKQPNIFDQGKEKAPQDRLRMPKPNLKDDDIVALTTFLLGSVDSTMPKEFFYDPPDQRKDVQEGMWVIKKYNCMGCHNVSIGQRSILQDLSQYQGEGREKLPPRLTSEGARVNPEWLLNFLSNPAQTQSQTDTDRNGVRTYLAVRMPTFSFSPNELQALVRFFVAASAQAEPYIPSKLDPITDQERDLARQLFTSKAAPCLKCHITGDPGHDKTASAPNFLLARERLKPEWTRRWMLDPALISPGTSMPSELFRLDGDRWILKGELPASFNSYDKDHVQLLVRYMFQLTPDEQRRLLAASPQTGTKMGTSTGPPTSSNRTGRGSSGAIAMSRGYLISH